ncbi:MAG: ribonuclease HII [Kiritimatiellia bacterium]|nr:ribonuclease HII [Kiritimatiellia bacterium]
MLAYEQQAWAKGFARVAGVDEAGRGPWAGPVYAAAVILPADDAERMLQGPLLGLTDSKGLSPSRREAFFLRLTQTPSIQWAVASVSAPEIDRLNILRATFVAMRQAVLSLPAPPDWVLVDGPRGPDLPCPSRCIVKGDSLSLSIAAASVVAKVLRDRALRGMDAAWPGYGFAQHKGYGTAGHQEALDRLGPCPEHRKSFRPVALRLKRPDEPEV